MSWIVARAAEFPNARVEADAQTEARAVFGVKRVIPDRLVSLPTPA